MRLEADDLPESLNLDEAYRAAFYFTLQWLELDGQPLRDGLVELIDYMWTDPARWGDFLSSVRRALADGGFADPDHEGLWQDRPEMPWNGGIRPS